MRIGITHEACLQHLIRAPADPWHRGTGTKRRLFYLGKVVFSVPIEFKNAHLNKRIFCMRPDLGEVERIPPEGAGLGLAHDLDAEAPLWVVPVRNGLEEVTLV